MQICTFLIKQYYFLHCKGCEAEIPNIGLISVKSDLVDEYTGDVLKDLPVLERYMNEF